MYGASLYDSPSETRLKRSIGRRVKGFPDRRVGRNNLIFFVPEGRVGGERRMDAFTAPQVQGYRFAWNNERNQCGVAPLRRQSNGRCTRQ